MFSRGKGRSGPPGKFKLISTNLLEFHIFSRPDRRSAEIPGLQDLSRVRPMPAGPGKNGAMGFEGDDGPVRLWSAAPEP